MRAEIAQLVTTTVAPLNTKQVRAKPSKSPFSQNGISPYYLQVDYEIVSVVLIIFVIRIRFLVSFTGIFSNWEAESMNLEYSRFNCIETQKRNAAVSYCTCRRTATLGRYTWCTRNPPRPRRKPSMSILFFGSPEGVKIPGVRKKTLFQRHLLLNGPKRGRFLFPAPFYLSLQSASRANIVFQIVVTLFDGPRAI